MRLERRGLAIAVAVAAVIGIGGLGWALGRATAPDDSTNDNRAPVAAGSAAIKTIGGIPVGVLHTPAGALAAADNYVAIATETVVQSPERYQQLVRRVYEPGYQSTALNGGQQVRQGDPKSVSNYAAGGRTVATVGARRLDSYGPANAQVTSWIGATTWGPQQRPGQSWALVETALRWDGQRWLIARIDQASRPAPAPTVVAYDDPSARTSATFSRELRAMAAPVYGGG